MYVFLGLLVLAGIVARMMGEWFTRQLRICLSLVLLVAMLAGMYVMGTNEIDRVRHAAGLRTFQDKRKGTPPPEPVGEAELAAVLATGRPWLLAITGYGGVVALPFLMMFKSF